MNRLSVILLVLIVAIATGGCAVTQSRENPKDPDPSPVISSLSPGSAVAGGPDFTLNVIGSNFGSESLALWNGSTRTTRFISSTQLAVAIARADIVQPGAATVVVSSARLNPRQSNSATLNVQPPAPLQISTSSLPPAAVQVPYSVTLTVEGGIAPFSWSVASGALPPGLTLGAANGTIAGTPTQQGQFNFTVQVSDSSPTRQTASRALQISITSAPPPLQITTSGLPAGQVGSAYSNSVAATGGVQPYEWSVASGALPPGLTLGAANGAIAGTPTQEGQFNFTVQVSDSSPTRQTASRALQVSITSAPVPLQIVTTGVPGGQVGSSYAASVVATGGAQPYSWSVVSGALPPGLALGAASGAISGTPTQEGQFNFTVQVSDSSPTRQTASRALQISVTNPVLPLRITTTGLPEGRVGIAYAATLTAAGGVLPYSWSVTSGALPPGLTLGAATGGIVGTPNAAGNYSFTVRVRDSATPSGSAANTFLISIAPSLPDYDPAAWKVMTWGYDTVEWSRRLNLAGLRIGCNSPPEECVSVANDEARRENVNTYYFSLDISPEYIPITRLSDFSARFSQLSVSNSMLKEIGLDDFSYRFLYYAYFNLHMTPSQVEALLNDVITATKSANPSLKFGVTIYENELRERERWYLEDAYFPPRVRERIDSVHLFINYRTHGPEFAQDVRRAKDLFPNAKIIAAAYAYDRIDYVPCVEEDHVPNWWNLTPSRNCTPDQERNYFRQSLEIQASLLKQGLVDWIELFPGSIGSEDQIPWPYYDSPPYGYGCRDLARCLANTRAMNQAASDILNFWRAASGILVSPAVAAVAPGGRQQFTAVAVDPSGNPISPQPTFSWSVTGGGVISGTGLFTAGPTPGGPFTVRASAHGMNGTASVTVQ